MTTSLLSGMRYVSFTRGVPQLTSSRCTMRGRAGSHGVGHPGSGRPIHRTESRKVFVVFILVRVVASFYVQWTSGLIARTEQIHTNVVFYLGYCGCVPQTTFKIYHSNRSITASGSWSYTYEVGIWRSSEGHLIRLTYSTLFVDVRLSVGQVTNVFSHPLHTTSSTPVPPLD